MIAAMERLIDLDLLQVRSVLPILLQDRTTDQNIIWATDTYEACGDGYSAKEPITSALVTGENSSIIQPRIAKAVSDQADRTKKHAEVFTPAWICNMMVNHCDEVWFGRKDVFNTSEDKSWAPSEAPIEFPKRKRWQRYVDSRRLEITCGEAPYLVSRYDASTGELIPFTHRIGILDRKLRVVNENAADEAEWLKFAFRALESVYGFEYQGDNLLIARVNVLMTFMDAVQEKWQREPTAPELKRVAEIISWNIWQMDGLKGTVPFGSLQEAHTQLSIWDLLGEMIPAPEEHKRPECQIYDWRGQGKLKYNDRKTRKGKEMKFDFVIGNPPYQEATAGASTSDKPVYDCFMDAAFKIADKVELITPGRFLFNAGATPTAWNSRMLEDIHFKVLFHEMNSSKVFANTAIVGGVAITYRDAKANYGSIGTYTTYPELNRILHKVMPSLASDGCLTQIIYTQNKFNLRELNAAIPGLNRTDKRLESNIFSLSVFTQEPTQEDDIKILGLWENKRTYRFVNRKFIDMSDSKNIAKYKILLSKSNGASGILGEEPARMITMPSIGEPYLGYTRTFIGIGALETLVEAEAALKYIKGKFCRLMLGVLKVTQDNNPDKWKYVPLQDFTSSSDIDWSVSVAEIDRQLYKKYNLNEEEIAFIETHVKEMV